MKQVLKRIKNKKFSKGQAVIESVLLITVLFGLTLIVFNGIKENQVISNLIDSPKKYIQGMSRSGVWKKHGEDIAEHPNQGGESVLQVKGDDAR